MLLSIFTRAAESCYLKSQTVLNRSYCRLKALKSNSTGQGHRRIVDSFRGKLLLFCYQHDALADLLFLCSAAVARRAACTSMKKGMPTGSESH